MTIDNITSTFFTSDINCNFYVGICNFYVILFVVLQLQINTKLFIKTDLLLPHVKKVDYKSTYFIKGPQLQRKKVYSYIVANINWNRFTLWKLKQILSGKSDSFKPFGIPTLLNHKKHSKLAILQAIIFNKALKNPTLLNFKSETNFF